MLFLIPVPWAGPVWAPLLVSLALIIFGLLMVGRCRRGVPRISFAQVALLLVAGLIVIVSFVLNAGVVVAGGVPTEFSWPVFAAGMLIGTVAAVRAVRAASR